MDINFLQLIFTIYIFFVIVGGCLINTVEKYLPVFVIQTCRYGKFAYKDKEKLSKFVIQMPKSTFRHLYRIAVIVFTGTLIIATEVYVYGHDVPDWLLYFVDLICGKDRVTYVNGTKAYIAIVLMSLQMYRRFYDTHFVSIFSKNGRISFILYMVAISFYPLVALAILCESPKFATIVDNNGYNNENFNLAQLSLIDIIGMLLFIWAWYHQYITTKILANLRRNKKGQQISEAHRVPEGDWFNYLSCPHHTAEILMYFALTLILWSNVTWRFVFVFVTANQVEGSVLSHWWYLETFSDYPKSRKALIPFVY